jgi:ankyrin repeat protein
MPTQVFIIPPKSSRTHKPLAASISDKCQTNSQSEPQTPIDEGKKFPSDQKLSINKTNPLIRINPPERLLDHLLDLDDEDQHFGRRVPSIRRPRQKYKEPLPRIEEHPTVSAIVSAPIVALPAGLITITPKQDGSTDSNESQGQTLLHLAARLGHEDIMRMLINETSHANVLLNNRGQTPLLCAIESGSTSTATLLMEQDPLSLTCKDSIGSSVFHYATEQCNDIVLSRAISLLKQVSSSAARSTVSKE